MTRRILSECLPKDSKSAASKYIPQIAGKKAVEMVDQQGFDIVVLDLAMPGMDGLETLKEIKAHDPDIEIVMLSGKGTMRSGIDAIKSGAEDFLEKPVDLSVLLDKIEEAKERRLLTLQRKASEKVSEILKRKAGRTRPYASASPSHRVYNHNLHHDNSMPQINDISKGELVVQGSGRTNWSEKTQKYRLEKNLFYPAGNFRFPGHLLFSALECCHRSVWGQFRVEP